MNSPVALHLLPPVKLFSRALVLGSLLLVAGCDWPASRTRHRGAPVVVDARHLRYPDGSTIDPGLHDIAFVAQLPAEDAPPFVIVEGRECDDCDAPPVIVMRSPNDATPSTLDRRPSVHPYPGRTTSRTDGTVLSYARTFWGECLPQRAAGVVSYRTDYSMPGEEPLREVHITEVQGDSLIDWRLVPDVRFLAATLLLVRAERCTEIAPREMVATP